jgi:broad-specificity NMP kinase
VEIVGPAGAGKTTLLLALTPRHGKIRAVFRLRSASYAPFFVGNAMLLLPTIFQVCRTRKWFTWQVIRMTIHLTAMRHILGRAGRDDGSVTVLDQGPVYMLTRLHELGFDGVTDSSLEKWWHGMLKYWAATLDIVIRLDAPDEILWQRIRARGKRHLAKTGSQKEAYEFLKAFRARYDQIIAQLTLNSGPTVVCFDTYRESLDQITEKVLELIT